MMTRHRFFLGILILAVIIGVGVCTSNAISNMPSQSSPTAVVEKAIKAFESKNIQKVSAYFTPVPGRLMALRLKPLFENFDTISVQELATRLILEEGAAAQVQAVYDLVVVKDGLINTEHNNKVIKLVRIDEKWWINEAF